MDNEFLTVKEAMQILRIGKTKMYKILRDNSLSHYRIEGKYLIPNKAIMDYLRKTTMEMGIPK